MSLFDVLFSIRVQANREGNPNNFNSTQMESKANKLAEMVFENTEY